MNTATEPKLIDIESLVAQIADQFTEEVKQRRWPSVEEYALRHPEISHIIRQVFPALAMLDDFSATGLPEANADGHVTGVLGDFRILRELGRGGMGVVYEAEQISLGRRVALKVLPFAAMLDKQQLNRFKNEARAAATLDHPNIVAIYSVGAERGVHFYAMQLIEGQSLAQVVQQLRIGCGMEDAGGRENATAAFSTNLAPSPRRGGLGRGDAAGTRDANTPPLTPRHQGAGNGSTVRDVQAALSTLPDFSSREYYRSVARLGIQAAEALDHAHQNGILHRDVKPANLMVDDTGKLWITDFGLARIEQDAGMTMTGDILGTLRYMSPEQALAKRVVVDHRSDIYSLGVTLYELLTLQPAFAGVDRQELLRQIAFEEPHKLRQINVRIPVELETIVQKAIRKEPEQRYATARDLADDLRRYLDNKIIKAKLPTRRERIVKWGRAHTGLVLTAGVVLVVLSTVLSVSTAWIKRAESRAVAALDQTSDLLYSTDMALAYETFDKGWSDEVAPLLSRYQPLSGKPDRRGFEWYLLNSLVQPPASDSLAGHRGQVNELAVFPDQQRLASVGNDGTLKIWDVQARQLIKSIVVCSEPLSSVAVSPDGRYVAAGATSVYLWDVSKDGHTADEIYRSEHGVESLAFSPDGQKLAAGSRYDEVSLLELSGKVIKQIACESRVESLEFIPGSSLMLIPNRRPLAASGELGFIQVWGDALSRLEQEFDATLNDDRGAITIARCSPCGRYVAAGERYRARALFFDRTTGEIVTSTPASRDRLTDLAYSPDGKAVAIAYENGRVEYFRLTTDIDGVPRVDRRPLIMDAHRGKATCLRFLEPGKLATCGADGLVGIWDVSAGGARRLDFTSRQINGLQLSPDSALLATACHQEVVVVDTQTGNVAWRHSRPDERFSEPVWTSDGDKIAVCCSVAQSADILDRYGETLVSIPFGTNPIDAAFSSDGSLVAIIGHAKLQICRTENGQKVFSQSLLDKGTSVAFSHDGLVLAYGGHLAGITIMDCDEMRILRELGCSSSVTSIAFSPDDSILATSHADSSIRLWETETGRLPAEMVSHERPAQSLAFSPDGRTLLSSGHDCTVRAWSVESGRCYGVVCRRAEGGTALTSEFSLARDGRRLAVAFSQPLDDGPDVLLWEIGYPAARPVP